MPPDPSASISSKHSSSSSPAVRGPSEVDRMCITSNLAETWSTHTHAWRENHKKVCGTLMVGAVCVHTRSHAPLYTGRVCVDQVKHWSVLSLSHTHIHEHASHSYTYMHTYTFMHKCTSVDSHSCTTTYLYAHSNTNMSTYTKSHIHTCIPI